MNNIFLKNGEILQFNGVEVYLTQNGNYIPSGTIAVEEINENTWSLSVNLQGEISIFFPTNNLDIIIGRELGYADKIHDRLFCYTIEGKSSLAKKYDLEHDFYTIIDVPQFHLIDSSDTSNDTISISHNGYCSIKSMHHAYNHYIQMTVITLPGVTSFHVDRSCNYLVNLQRFHPLPKKTISAFEPWNRDQLDEAVYYISSPNWEVSIPPNCLESAREIQSILSNNGIKSVIIGGIAKRLNGIRYDVHDIDIMVKTQHFNQDLCSTLSGYADLISSSYYSHRFNYNGITVDISNDNFNILEASNYVRTRHGLTFLDLEGLMWLYLINYYTNSSFNMDIRKYKVSLTQIYRNLLSNVTAKTMYHNIPDLNEKYINLFLQFSKAEQLYKDIRINKPFQVNSFRLVEKELFAVINNGSTCDARLVVDSHPKFATWSDVDGGEEKLKIEEHENFSCIFIPSVNYPGYVVCAT